MLDVKRYEMSQGHFFDVATGKRPMDGVFVSEADYLRLKEEVDARKEWSSLVRIIFQSFQEEPVSLAYEFQQAIKENRPVRLTFPPCIIPSDVCQFIFKRLNSIDDAAELGDQPFPKYLAKAFNEEVLQTKDKQTNA